MSRSKEEHSCFYRWMRYVFYAGSLFVLNLTVLFIYLLPIRRQLPCAKLVIFKKKLPFLLEATLDRLRQSSQLCGWLQWLCCLSSMYMAEAEAVALESNKPNPSLFHLRYSASKCSIKLTLGFKLVYANHLQLRWLCNPCLVSVHPFDSVSLRTPLQAKEQCRPLLPMLSSNEQNSLPQWREMASHILFISMAFSY